MNNNNADQINSMKIPGILNHFYYILLPFFLISVAFSLFITPPNHQNFKGVFGRFLTFSLEHAQAPKPNSYIILLRTNHKDCNKFFGYVVREWEGGYLIRFNS